MDQQRLVFDKDLINRYNKAGPRYTSYPTAVQFHENFGPAEYRRYAQHSNSEANPLSLYFHIPFCDTVCYYCACNKVVTKHRDKAAPYLSRLYKEIAMQGGLFDKSRPVDQLHWGGGTPTFISHAQMRELMDTTRQYFQLHDDDSGEYSIEVDPREADAETITLLRDIGFNRLSLGVQDFDPRVQQAVNRIQSEAETMAVLEAARANNFHSISVDLIYGLPHQSVESFLVTLDKIIDIGADRLSVFNYAHLPDLFKPQRRINADELPPPEEKLNILQATIDHLLAAGYVYIGMDHFAKPDDELAQAQRNGTLHRNFQGYSTHADCDLIAMGSTSVGKIGRSYSQNRRGLDDYYAALDGGELPIFRGLELTDDDVLRRAVITQLICHFELSIPRVESEFGIRFDDYFADAFEDLQQMQADGLLTFDAESIQVQPAGKLMIRNICTVFDAYLRQATEKRFSKLL